MKKESDIDKARREAMTEHHEYPFSLLCDLVFERAVNIAVDRAIEYSNRANSLNIGESDICLDSFERDNVRTCIYLSSVKHGETTCNDIASAAESIVEFMVSNGLLDDTEGR